MNLAKAAAARRTRSLFLSVGMVALSWPQLTLAQDQNAEAEQSDPAAAEEAAAPEDGSQVILVTGSRIRGVAPVGSPSIGLNEEQIDSTGVTSASEVLRRVPQIAALGTVEAPGGVGQDASSNPFRSNGINLRGLGTYATLVMINGARSVPMGSFGNFVDPSGLPTVALERIEVVPDGASAIYGSDAIAGVVNILTRKRFDGIEAQGRFGLADGGYEEYQIGAIGGLTWDNAYVTIAAEYLNKELLLGTARPSITSDQRPYGGQDYRSMLCNPGNEVIGNTFYPLPPAGGVLVAGAPNRCDNTQLGTLLPSQERTSATLAAGVDLTPGIDLSFDGYWTKREFASLNVPTGTVTVRNTNPYFLRPPGSTLTAVNVQYSFFPIIGYTESSGSEEAYQGILTLNADLGSDWNAKLLGTYGKSEDATVSEQQLNATALAAAGASSNPATALNPFGTGSNDPAFVRSLFNGMFNIQGTNEMASAGVQFDGPYLQLPGGAMRLAIGGEYRWEKNTGITIGGNTAVPAPTPAFEGDRNIKAVFTEIYLPIFGADNAIPGFDRLDMSFALRWEDYSDVGTTTNPKVGITWEPFDSVRVRGSYGTSFRAPYIPQSNFRSGGFGIYAANNRPDPLSPTGFSSGISLAGGNPELEPETATTWTAGVDLDPLPGLRISGTWFSIDYENQIIALQGNPTILQDPSYAAYVLRNPTPAQIAAVLNFDGAPVPINGVLPPVISFILDGRRNNAGITHMQGIDGEASYRWTMDDWTFNVGATGSYLTKLKSATTPAAPVLDVRDLINQPAKFRMRGELGASRGPLDAYVFVNHVNGYQNNLVNPVYDIDSYTTFDLNVAYRVELGLGETTFRVGVLNLFDEKPPTTNTERGYDPQMANALGRLVSFTINQKI